MICKLQRPLTMIIREKGLSVIIHVWTQNMMSYSWIG